MDRSSVFRRHSSAPHPEIVRGEGVYLFDRDGRRYIDASGGALVVSVGHGVAEIADAAREQTGRLAYVHGSEFTSPTCSLSDCSLRHLFCSSSFFFLSW